MNCFDCKIPCEYSNPLGYCYKEQSGLPHGSFEKGYQPADAMKALDEKIKRVSEKGTWDGIDVDKYIAELRGLDTELQQAAKALVDAVDRYTMGKCLRSELLNKNNELKRLLNDN